MKKIYHKDFFIYHKKHHWFIIPTIVFYYRKTQDLHVTEPIKTWGLTIRFLTYMMGIQIEQELTDEHN